jgi:hypothetical protein
MPSKTYECIMSTKTTNSATPTIYFNSISAAYTDLILIVSAGETSAAGGIGCLINSDSTSLYSYTQLYGIGSTAGSNRTSNESYLNLFGVQNGTNARGAIVAQFMSYANTAIHKTIVSRGNSDGVVSTRAYLYRSGNAISSLTLTAQGTYFSENSVFSLYGIKAA